jgi:hypothetical protein
MILFSFVPAGTHVALCSLPFFFSDVVFLAIKLYSAMGPQKKDAQNYNVSVLAGVMTFFALLGAMQM